MKEARQTSITFLNVLASIVSWSSCPLSSFVFCACDALSWDTLSFLVLWLYSFLMPLLLLSAWLSHVRSSNSSDKFMRNSTKCLLPWCWRSLFLRIAAKGWNGVSFLPRDSVWLWGCDNRLTEDVLLTAIYFVHQPLPPWSSIPIKWLPERLQLISMISQMRKGF